VIEKRKETFLAIDGTSLAYRSHFAFINRPLTTRSGEVTSAVFGFILTLRRILELFEPDAVVVVFDAPAPTFRHELFKEYKATRERMPLDLRSQLGRIEEYLDCAGIPRLSIPGVEADDVMASLAKRAVEEGMKGRILSNDKDLLQIVGKGIEVVNLGRANEPPKVMGRAEVKESFGVPPEKIVDLLALTGDASDNVPGIPGVGRKTAAKLLEEHGSLEALLLAAPAIKQKKLRESLSAKRDDVLFSRRLVELKTDVEVADPKSFRRRPSDEKGLDDLFEELDFQSLKKEERTATPSDTSLYETITGEAALSSLVKRLASARRFAFGAETGGKEAMRGELLGLSFALGEGCAFYVPLSRAEGSTLERDVALKPLAALLEDPKIEKWAQDAKFLLVLLGRSGVSVSGIVFDTMLASYVLDPSRNSHGLEELARDHLAIQMISSKELLGKAKSRGSVSEAPLEELSRSAAERAEVVFRLRERLEPEIDAAGLSRILHDIELPLLGVLARMERTGVRVDVEFLGSLSERMEKELHEIEAKAFRVAGQEFNLASPKQVAELLFGKLGLRPGRRTKTGLSTDADVLQELAAEHEVPKLVLRHREIAKLKSTYVDALPLMVNPETGRVHTSYNQAVAATGRLSSAEPNLQNVPVRTWEGREIRKAFVPSREDGRLVSCDYSQIELRIMAHMSGDESLVAAFREDKDVHAQAAASIFGVAVEAVTGEQRAAAKTVNYAVMYGMGAVNLGRSLGIPTREAARFIEAYFTRYPGVQDFIDRAQDEAREKLYVETLAGRRRPVPEIASADHRTRSFGERIAVNTPIQGTAADIMKLAMIAIQERLDARELAARMILTVHDELVFDCPEEECEEVKDLAVSHMESALELSVPLKVDSGIGRNWSEAH
jgi:DNA polymerase-1